MSSLFPPLGRCTPHLVNRSLVNYFGPCIAADPQVVAKVIGGACELDYAGAMQALVENRLPTQNGRLDEVDPRKSEYAVQFVLDCAKDLSVRSIILKDQVAAEAIARARQSVCNFIVGAVPITPFSEQMIDRTTGAVKCLAVQITEKLTRPDKSGICYAHDHDHLIIHPHAVDHRDKIVTIYRELLLRAEPLITDLYRQALVRTLTACNYDFDGARADEVRAWETAFSIRNKVMGERKRKLPYTVEQMRLRWAEIIVEKRLQALTPLTEPREWPEPITREMVLETAERYNYFAKPEHLAELDSLGRRVKTLSSFGHTVQLRHNRKAAALTVDSQKTEKGIDLIVTVGGPKHGPINRIATALLANTTAQAAALDFANLVRKKPLIVRTGGLESANNAIRQHLSASGKIGIKLGSINTAKLSEERDGAGLNEEELIACVGGFAAPNVNLKEGWFRRVFRKVIGVNKTEVMCEGFKKPVNAKLLMFAPADQILVHRGDWMRLTRSHRCAKIQLDKGRLVRVHRLCGEEVETTGGKVIPAAVLEWAFCTSDPTKGVGYLAHPLTEIHKEIGSWNPRTPPSFDQIEALSSLAPPATDRVIEMKNPVGGILELVFKKCSKLAHDTVRHVLDFYSAYAGVSPPELTESAEPLRTPIELNSQDQIYNLKELGLDLPVKKTPETKMLLKVFESSGMPASPHLVENKTHELVDSVPPNLEVPSGCLTPFSSATTVKSSANGVEGTQPAQNTKTEKTQKIKAPPIIIETSKISIKRCEGVASEKLILNPESLTKEKEIVSWSLSMIAKIYAAEAGREMPNNQDIERLLQLKSEFEKKKQSQRHLLFCELHERYIAIAANRRLQQERDVSGPSI